MNSKFRLQRAVTNPALELFKIGRKDEKLLLKVFRQSHLKDMQREIRQYGYFKGLPFIPTLNSYSSENGIFTITYKWIQGNNGYDFLRSTLAGTKKAQQEIFETVVDQMMELGNCISNKQYAKLKRNGTNFSMSNPLQEGLLNPREELEFAENYKIINKVLQKTCKLFPGIYTDRNPGNFIVSARLKKIYQVDFGLTEATTPVLDLTKLLRTRTCEPSMRRLKNLKTSFSHVADVEREVLDYAYKKFVKSSRYDWTGSRAELDIHFLYAALREHIFYTTKAEFLLRTKAINSHIQKLRKEYHIKMLNETYDTLIYLKEPVSLFGHWVKRFTNI